MRLLIIFLFVSIFSFGQGGGKVDALKFRGKVTTAVRNTIDVPTGEFWLIYNTTTEALEVSDETDTWSNLGSLQTPNINFDGYTLAERNNLDVPTGEFWLIYNTTSDLLEISDSTENWQSVGDGIQPGQNSIPAGISLDQAITNKIEIIPASAGLFGSNPAIRIIAGNQDDAVYFVMYDDVVSWSFESSSQEYTINPAGEISPNNIARKSYVDAAIAAIPSGGTIADNSITSAKIANGTILEEDLSVAVVTKLNANGSGISSIVEDTAPTLGGNLDANSRGISNLLTLNFNDGIRNLQHSFNGITGKYRIVPTATTGVPEILEYDYNTNKWQINSQNISTGSGGGAAQNLTLSGSTLGITSGNTVDLSSLTGTSIFSTRGAPPNETQTIAQAYPSVTLAQVQALAPTATLSDSASWFYLQEVISSFSPRFFFSSSAQSRLDVPTGNYRLSRPIVIQDLANMVIDWHFNFLRPFNGYTGFAIEYNGQGVQNSNRDVHNLNLRIRGEWVMSGVRVSEASQWLIGGQIDQVRVGMSIQDTYYGGFAPSTTIRECMTGFEMEYGGTDPKNEINTINFTNLTIGGANKSQIVSSFGLPAGTLRYGIYSRSRHSQINFNQMTIEGVDHAMYFDDTLGNITLRGSWGNFYYEDIDESLFHFVATRGNSEVDLSIIGAISNIWVPDVNFVVGAKGFFTVENIAKNPGSNLGVRLEPTPLNDALTLVTDFEPSRVINNRTAGATNVIYTGKSLLSNTFAGGGGSGMTAAQITLEANRALPPLRSVLPATSTLSRTGLTVSSGGNIGRRNYMSANTNATLTLGSGFLVDDIIPLETIGAAQLNLLPPSGESFLINGVPTSGGVTLTRNYGLHSARKVSATIWEISSENVVAYAPPTVQNLFPNGNPASPTPNEGAALTLWTTNNTSPDTSVSVDTAEFTNGSSSVRVNNTVSASFRYGRVDVTGLANGVYDISYDVRRISGSGDRLQIRDGSGSPTEFVYTGNYTTGFAPQTVTGVNVTSGTLDLRFYTTWATDGLGEILVDNIVLTLQ